MHELFEQWYTPRFAVFGDALDQKDALERAFVAGHAAQSPPTLEKMTAQLRTLFREAEEAARLRELLQMVERDPESLLHRANSFLAGLLQAYQCRHCHSYNPTFHLHDCPIRFQEVLRLPVLAPHPADAEVERLQAHTRTLRDEALEAAAVVATASVPGETGTEIAARIRALKRPADPLASGPVP